MKSITPAIFHRQALYSVLLLWMISAAAMGQNKPPDVAIFIGNEIITDKKEWVDEIIGKDDGGVYMMAKYRKQITLFYYDTDFTLIRKNTVDLADHDSDLIFKGIVPVGDTLYLLTTFTDTKKKEVYLLAQPLHKQTLEFSAPIKLSSLSYEGYRRYGNGNFDFTVSPDSNYLLIMSSLSVTKDSTNYGVAVLDKEMNMVWGNNNVMLTAKNYELLAYQADVGNNGSVYMLTKSMANSKKEKRAYQKEVFTLIEYNPEADTASTTDISISNKRIADVQFERMANGNIHIIGFYSLEQATEKEQQEGVFNMYLNGQTKQVISQETTEFPTDFITQHQPEKERERAFRKEAKGKDITLYAYQIDDLVENYDGSVTLIGEQYYYYQTCVTDVNGNQNCTDHYVYGHIIIVKFTLTGEVDWMELLPKSQQTINDDGFYSSYALCQLDDGSLCFIFNDNPKNNYYTNNGRLSVWGKSRRKTDVIMYRVLEEGRVDRYTLFTGLKEEVMAHAKVSEQISPNELILVGQGNRITKFVKITFNP